MKSKFTILILISALALIALCAIQAYLISNTYALKKDAFFDLTDTLISEIPNDRALDSIYDLLIEEELKVHISDYLNNRITRRQVQDRLFRSADSVNEAYMTIYRQNMRALELDYNILFSYDLESILILNNPSSDTVFKREVGKRDQIFGDLLGQDETRIINTSRTFETRDYIEVLEDTIISGAYDFEIRTNQKMQIPRWKQIILKQMSVLIVGSIVLFLFVIGLLYYSIKNLITQKILAEVKTDFINNVTHELKTPLATLGIATSSLRNETIRNNKQAFDNTLGIVERQNNRLQKLIDQVLTNSLEADEVQLSKEQVVDNLFFANLLSDFKIAQQHEHLEIVNKICTQEILLRVDRFYFTTAILNILENAVKYGKEKTTIIVSSRLSKNHYVLDIIDDGIGISSKDQEAIFDKFYRAGNTTVHNVKGLGLGLYLTHQIITAHGGEISLESQEGKGSTFTITIPI